MKIKSLTVAIFAALFLYVALFAQSPIKGTITKNANLRDGPGTTYAIAGTVKAGQSVSIIGKSADDTWYQLSDGHWVAAFLVTVANAPTSTATIILPMKTVTPVWTPTATQAPTITAIITIATVIRRGNLRAEPDSTVGIVGVIMPGQTITITGPSKDNDWYPVSGGGWAWRQHFKIISTKRIAMIAPIPTPIPTFTPTVSPSQVLKTSISEALGRSNRSVERVTKVEVEPESIAIQWSINDNLTMNMVSGRTHSDVIKILNAVHDSGLKYVFVTLSGTFLMVDKFGKQEEATVVFLMYLQDTVEKINWTDRSFVDYMLRQNIYDIADNKELHPQFQIP